MTFKYDVELIHSLPEHTFWPMNPRGFDKVRRFGHNEAIVSGQFDPVWGGTGAYPWPTSAAPIRIKAGGDVADTALGLGAQSVLLFYMDTTGTIVSQVIATAGASVSLPTLIDGIRFIRAYVIDVGAYGVANTADIEFEQVGVGDVIGVILAGSGQTQHAIHTIPVGWAASFLSFHVTIDGSKVASFRVCRRGNSVDLADKKSIRIVSEFDATASLNRRYRVSEDFNALDDIWVDAKAASGQTDAVSAEFDMILHEV